MIRLESNPFTPHPLTIQEEMENAKRVFSSPSYPDDEKLKNAENFIDVIKNDFYNIQRAAQIEVKKGSLLPKGEKFVREAAAFTDREIELLKLLIECIRASKEGREEDAHLLSAQIRKKIEDNKTLREQFFKVSEEIIEEAKTEKNLSIASWVLAALAIVGVIASFIVSLVVPPAAGGFAAAVAAAIPYISSLPTIGTGIVDIATASVEHKSSLKTAEMEKIKYERHGNRTAIEDNTKAIETALSEAVKYYRELSELIKNRGGFYGSSS